MNVIFMGTMDFAVPILEGLARTHHVALVVTQPDRPVGRRQVLEASPVKKAAVALDIPVFQPERIRRDHAPVLAVKADLIVVAAYGQMIPDVVLFQPPYKSINVHASLLPKYRGGAPMHRAIASGEAETGVTVMAMASKMDAGGIFAQRAIPILDGDDVGTLEAKLAVLGRDLLLETLPRIIDGSLAAVPQDETRVTFAPNIRPEEERLNFHGTMRQVFDHVRAFRPWPTTHAEVDGLKILIHAVRMVPDPDGAFAGAAHGTIVRTTRSAVFVKVADGLIEPLTIQPAGKTRMEVRDYLNGAGKTVLAQGRIFNLHL
ncbi:MAG: methionyl-tRNA formyltransferase [Candidatus Izemoplasmatales bacterium]